MLFLGIAAIVSFFVKIPNYEFIILLFALLFAFNLVWTMLIYHQYSRGDNSYNFSPEKFWVALFGKIRVKEEPFYFLVMYTPAVSDKLEIFENSVKKQGEWKITTKRFDCQDKNDLEENKKHKQELECILFPENSERKFFAKEKKLTTQSISGIIILYTDDTLDDTLELVAKWAKLKISQPIFCVNYSKKRKPPYTFKSIQSDDKCLKNAWVDMLIYGTHRGKASGKVVKSTRPYLIGLFCVTLLTLILSVVFFSIMREKQTENIDARANFRKMYPYVQYAEIFKGKDFLYDQVARNCLYKVIGKRETPKGLTVSFWEINDSIISNISVVSNNYDVTPFPRDTTSIIGAAFENPGYFIIWERPYDNREYTDNDIIYYYNVSCQGMEESKKKVRDEKTGNIKVYDKDKLIFEAIFLDRGDRDNSKDYILTYSIKREGNPQIGVCIEVFSDYQTNPYFLYTLKTRTILWEAVNDLMIYLKNE